MNYMFILCVIVLWCITQHISKKITKESLVESLHVRPSTMLQVLIHSQCGSHPNHLRDCVVLSELRNQLIFSKYCSKWFQLLSFVC